MDLSKVVCKALINFSSESQFWTSSLITEISQLATSINEDLESILEMAGPNDKAIIEDLSDLTRTVLTSLPQLTFDCKISECGRKGFKSAEELLAHTTRKHPNVK